MIVARGPLRRRRRTTWAAGGALPALQAPRALDSATWLAMGWDRSSSEEMLGRTSGNGHVLGFVGAHSVLDLPDVPRVEMTYGCGSVFPSLHGTRHPQEPRAHQRQPQSDKLLANGGRGQPMQCLWYYQVRLYGHTITIVRYASPRHLRLR